MRHPRLVLAIFILSGAAGLMYEVVWSRQLVLVFGNTTQAVSTILTGFFGGMAIGSYVGGRVADRVRSPLRLYGAIELVLVVIVLLTPITFRLVHEAYRGVFPSIEGQPVVLALIRFVLAVLALAPATVLMGATLPTLTRSLTSDDHLSKAFARLYAANTIGAILGTLLAGVVLIEIVGLTATLVVGAAFSGTAGAVAWMLARSAPPASSHAPRPRSTRGGPAVRLPRIALLLAFVSGLTSLGYQVLWTRLLSSGTGNSTYVFTLILATFLIGIAFGATVFSTVRARIRRPIVFIAGAQVAVAALVLWGLVVIIAHPGVIDPGKPLETAGTVIGPLMLVVLPATAVMGFTFPATSTLVSDDAERIAANAGRLLAANTIGAILATFVIPFFVIPLIGSPNAVAILALVNLATAVALMVSGLGRGTVDTTARVATTVGAAVVTLAIVVSLVTRDVIVDPSVARIRALGAALFASHEDEIASVQAGATLTPEPRPQLWVTGTAMTLLTIDAKLMPVLPLALRPESTKALVVAFGMGSAYRSAVIAGLQTTAVELVPTVPEFFPYFYPDAAQIESNPNSRIIVTDGRNHLELTTERYDIIVTDPPPPIFSSGASVISSLEYYEAGRAHLSPGGIMMQWVPYGSSIDEFRAHVRTFQSVFPNVMMLFGQTYGLYMMGSDQPMTFDDARLRATLSRPGLLEDISSAYDSPAHDLDGWITRIHQMQWISGDQIPAFAGDGPLVTDDRPLPEYFLLRRWLNGKVPQAGPDLLRSLTPPS